MAGDDHAHDFGSAFGNQSAALIDEPFCQREIQSQADAAVDLQHPIDDAKRHLVNEQFDHVSFVPNILASVSLPSRLIHLSLIHISEPTRLLSISYAVFCLKKKK